jgi:hypothetical protein
MMIEKPLPSSSKQRAAVYAVVFVIFTGVVVFGLRSVDTLLAAPVLICSMVLFAFFYYRRRCPECGDILRFRRDYFPGSSLFRCLHECHRCKIAWVRPDIGDDTQM